MFLYTISSADLHTFWIKTAFHHHTKLF